jgi:hypothetical protein
VFAGQMQAQVAGEHSGAVAEAIQDAWLALINRRR